MHDLFPPIDEKKEAKEKVSFDLNHNFNFETMTAMYLNHRHTGKRFTSTECFFRSLSLSAEINGSIFQSQTSILSPRRLFAFKFI